MAAQLISRATDCNILKFISCKFDSDLEVLIISGTPRGEDLFDAWDNIHMKYIDLTGTFIPEVKLVAKVKEIEVRIAAVNHYLHGVDVALEHLGYPFAEEAPGIEEGLIHNGIHLHWDPNDPQDFKSQLEEVRTNEKRHIVQLNKANKELETYRKKQSTTPSHDNNREEFERMLINLQRPPMNFKIDRQTTTVYELGIMVKDFMAYIEQSKQIQSQARS